VLVTPGQEAAAKATQDEFFKSLEGAGLPAGSLPGEAGLTPANPELEAQNARAQANATAGIADVTELLKTMPRLATFTPEPGGSRNEGELVYLRNGGFYRAPASAGGGKALALENPEMPPVWAPPDDPGKAWLSPDGQRVAFFAGPDAAMWVMGIDGQGNRAVSDDNLPSEKHAAELGDGGEQTLRLRPGKDYTLVRLTGADEPLSVLIDDNTQHIRGQSRLRVVHAAEGLADSQLVVYIDGKPLGAPMSYGRANGFQSVAVGQVQLEIRDSEGNPVTTLPPLALGEKELKTVFLTGDADALSGVPVTYDPGEAAGMAANVRVFNAGSTPLDLSLDESHKLAGALVAGSTGPYVRVPAALSVSQHQDMQILLYGLRGNEYPVAWSPDSQKLAFLGAGDGKIDLYMTDAAGKTQRLTNDPVRELNPIWSPDGQSLVWLAEDQLTSTYSLNIWREGDARPRTVDLAPVRQAAGLEPTEKIFLPEDVVWIDDERLAFFPAHGAQQSLGVWQADANTGAAQPLYREPIDELDWSPEAKAWAFSSDPKAGKLVVLSTDGKVSPLVDGNAHHPQWSPNGREISYTEGDPVGSQGWRLHIVGADGSQDRVLTDWWPLMQGSMPAPGPNAKRFWLEDGKVLVFSRVGQDYGAADRAGIGRQVAAGPDIENLYAVRTDGSGQAAAPQQLTDLTQVFYLDGVTPSPGGDTLALVGLWYASRAQQLWAVPADGGKPVQIDGPVRWFAWAQ
jgi:Tol biopolymer transport system component